MSNSKPSKDLFSTQSKEYALFRPRYPRSLFDFLKTVVNENKLAWDCATGSGQAAIELAQDFVQIVATDHSEKQLAHAEKRANIVYRKGTAEQSGLESSSVDLTTVAQAFHWFDFAEFFKEVERVSKPFSVLALWTYNLGRSHQAVDKVVYDFYQNQLKGFWDDERKWVESGYADIEIPYSEIKSPSFEMITEWSLPQLLGYLKTWSATQKWLAENPRNTMEIWEKKLIEAWGSKSVLRFQWPLATRIFRINDR